MVQFQVGSSFAGSSPTRVEYFISFLNLFIIWMWKFWDYCRAENMMEQLLSLMSDTFLQLKQLVLDFRGMLVLNMMLMMIMQTNTKNINRGVQSFVNMQNICFNA